MDLMKATIDRTGLRRIARKLQAGHAKETTGKIPSWAGRSDDERKLWMRLAARGAAATIQELTALESGPAPEKAAA
jgi:hypothetical protein